MNLIQQVLLSVHFNGNERKGCVVDSTEAIHQVDLQEMSDWFSGTSLDSAFRFQATNLFFHPLPSGNYTIGRMIPCQRGFFSFLKGQNSFLVQYLVVSPKLLAGYANNPITLYQKIVEEFPALLFTQPPKNLVPFSLSYSEQNTKDTVIDLNQIRPVIENVGIDVVSSLMQSTLDSVCTFFTGGFTSLNVISTVLNLLPVSWRPELTFSTELNISLTRPLKLVGISGGADMFNINSSDRRISFCDLDLNGPLAGLSRCGTSTLDNKWAKFIHQVIAGGNIEFLRRKFCKEWEQKQKESNSDDSHFIVLDELDFLAQKWSNELAEKSLHYALCSNRHLAVDYSQLITPEDVVIRNKYDTIPDELNLPQSQSHKSDRCQESDIDESDIERYQFQTEYLFTNFQPLEKYSIEYSSESEDTNELATMMLQKIVKVSDATQAADRCRAVRFPHISKEILNLDSCAARFLFGDRSALLSFKKNWETACSHVNPSQKLELTEEYITLVRDFLENSHTPSGCRIPERDINVLEILDLLLM